MPNAARVLSIKKEKMAFVWKKSEKRTKEAREKKRCLRNSLIAYEH